MATCHCFTSPPAAPAGHEGGLSTTPWASLETEMRASPLFQGSPVDQAPCDPSRAHPGVGTLLQVVPTGVTGLLGTHAGTEPSQGATMGPGPVAFSLEIWAEGLSAPHALTHPEQGLIIIIYRNRAALQTPLTTSSVGTWVGREVQSSHSSLLLSQGHPRGQPALPRGVGAF